MKKVVVGMSGGVDSSVTALLLKKQGYDVIGINLNVWEKKKDDETCSCKTTPDGIADAKKICEKLNIPFYTLDFKDMFKKHVIDYFAKEYIEGKTPNPCIACNRYIKFEKLLDYAKNKLGAQYIATGHYAKVEQDKKTGRYFLRESITATKDQTYALYNLTQEQLGHLILPLGDYTKEEIRKIAKDNELENANKSDSQEICFVDDNNYSKFIEENYNYKSKPGNFVNKSGKILGKHKGIIHYTIGQRRGLGLSLKSPLYVTKLDVSNNNVILDDNDALFSETLICKDLNFMPFESLTEPLICLAKVRYSAKKADCTIYPLEDGNVKVMFKEAQRAITPGQAVVFYDKDIVLGGGIII